MREIPISTSEKKFITKALSQSKRLDGRKLDECRELKIHFGREWGTCFVTLGSTMVMAQVSCEIQQPKTTRPNEGLVFLNVDVTPMAAPHFEVGTRSELSVHLNRMLEKCIKESKAVDLEALCVVADEKVWVLRVDVNIINHEGNLIDCSSVAALAALAHFKRPDVTSDGEEIQVHDPSERDPIPITLHHHPVCVSFAIVSETNTMLSDPTALEENVADASLVFGVNAYKELCALHLGGSGVLPPRDILRCGTKAAVRAKHVVTTLKTAIAEDADLRQLGKCVGFVDCVEFDKITSLSQNKLKIQLNKFRLDQPLDIHLEERKYSDNEEKEDDSVEEMEIDKDQEFSVKDLGDHSAELTSKQPSKKASKKLAASETPRYGEGGPSKWTVTVDTAPVDAAMESGSDGEEIAVMDPPPKIPPPSIELSDGSDEEVVEMDQTALEASDKVKPTPPVSKQKSPKVQAPYTEVEPVKYQPRKKQKKKGGKKKK